MEFFVAIALFFIFFWLASGALAIGIAAVYLLFVMEIVPWWLIMFTLVAWVYWLGADDPE